MAADLFPHLCFLSALLATTTTAPGTTATLSFTDTTTTTDSKSKNPLDDVHQAIMRSANKI